MTLTWMAGDVLVADDPAWLEPADDAPRQVDLAEALWLAHVNRYHVGAPPSAEFERLHPRWPKGTPKIAGEFIKVGQHFTKNGTDYRVTAVGHGLVHAVDASAKKGVAGEQVTLKTTPEVPGGDHFLAGVTLSAKGSTVAPGTEVVDPTVVASGPHDPSLLRPPGLKVTDEQWKRFGKLDQENAIRVQALFGDWSESKARKTAVAVFAGADEDVRKIVYHGFQAQYGGSSGKSLSLESFASPGEALTPAKADKLQRAFELQGAYQDVGQWDLYNRLGTPDVMLFHAGSQSPGQAAAAYSPGGKFGHVKSAQSYSWTPFSWHEEVLHIVPFSIRQILMHHKLAGKGTQGSNFQGENEFAIRAKHTFNPGNQLILAKSSLTPAQKTFLKAVTTNGKVANGDEFQQFYDNVTKGTPLSHVPMPAQVTYEQVGGATTPQFTMPPPEAFAPSAAGTVAGDDPVPVTEMDLQPGDYLMGLSGKQTKYIVVKDPTTWNGLRYMKISEPTKSYPFDSASQGQKFYKLTGHYTLPEPPKPVVEGEPAPFDPATVVVKGGEPVWVHAMQAGDIVEVNGDYVSLNTKPTSGSVKVTSLATGKVGSLNTDAKLPVLMIGEPPPPPAPLLEAGAVFAHNGSKHVVTKVLKDGSVWAKGPDGKAVFAPGSFNADGPLAGTTFYQPSNYEIAKQKTKLGQLAAGSLFHAGTGTGTHKPSQVVSQGASTTLVRDLQTGQVSELSKKISVPTLEPIPAPSPPLEEQAPAVEDPLGVGPALTFTQLQNLDTGTNVVMVMHDNVWPRVVGHHGVGTEGPFVNIYHPGETMSEWNALPVHESDLGSVLTIHAAPAVTATTGEPPPGTSFQAQPLGTLAPGSYFTFAGGTEALQVKAHYPGADGGTTSYVDAFGKDHAVPTSSFDAIQINHADALAQWEEEQANAPIVTGPLGDYPPGSYVNAFGTVYKIVSHHADGTTLVDAAGKTGTWFTSMHVTPVSPHDAAVQESGWPFAQSGGVFDYPVGTYVKTNDGTVYQIKSHDPTGLQTTTLVNVHGESTVVPSIMPVTVVSATEAGVTPGLDSVPGQPLGDLAPGAKFVFVGSPGTAYEVKGHYSDGMTTYWDAHGDEHTVDTANFDAIPITSAAGIEMWKQERATVAPGTSGELGDYPLGTFFKTADGDVFQLQAHGGDMSWVLDAEGDQKEMWKGTPVTAISAEDADAYHGGGHVTEPATAAPVAFTMHPFQVGDTFQYTAKNGSTNNWVITADTGTSFKAQKIKNGKQWGKELLWSKHSSSMVTPLPKAAPAPEPAAAAKVVGDVYPNTSYQVGDQVKSADTGVVYHVLKPAGTVTGMRVGQPGGIGGPDGFEVPNDSSYAYAGKVGEEPAPVVSSTPRIPDTLPPAVQYTNGDAITSLDQVKPGMIIGHENLLERLFVTEVTPDGLRFRSYEADGTVKKAEHWTTAASFNKIAASPPSSAGGVVHKVLKAAPAEAATPEPVPVPVPVPAAGEALSPEAAGKAFHKFHKTSTKKGFLKLAKAPVGSTVTGKTGVAYTVKQHDAGSSVLSGPAGDVVVPHTWSATGDVKTTTGPVYVEPAAEAAAAPVAAPPPVPAPDKSPVKVAVGESFVSPLGAKVTVTGVEDGSVKYTLTLPSGKPIGTSMSKAEWAASMASGTWAPAPPLVVKVGDKLVAGSGNTITATAVSPKMISYQSTTGSGQTMTGAMLPIAWEESIQGGWTHVPAPPKVAGEKYAPSQLAPGDTVGFSPEQRLTVVELLPNGALSVKDQTNGATYTLPPIAAHVLIYHGSKKAA